MARYETNAFYHKALIESALSAQPIAALDGFCAGNAKELQQGLRVLNDSRHSSEGGRLQWTRIALRFLDKAPQPGEVLKQFVSRFTPGDGWSGSPSAILESNAALPDDLAAYPRLVETVA